MKIIKEYEQEQIKVQGKNTGDKTGEINELWNNLISYQDDP